MSKKGFANVAIIILVVVAASFVGYFAFRKSTPQDVPNNFLTTETTPPSQTVPTPDELEAGATDQTPRLGSDGGSPGIPECPVSLADPGEHYVRLVDRAGAPSIEVIAPNGGEQWLLNDTSYRFIEWSGVNQDYTRVDAYLEKLENGKFITVGKIRPFSAGSIGWVTGVVEFPSEEPCGGQPWPVYTIEAQDRSDKPFSIVLPPTVTELQIQFTSYYPPGDEPVLTKSGTVIENVAGGQMNIALLFPTRLVGKTVNINWELITPERQSVMPLNIYAAGLWRTMEVPKDFKSKI